MNNLANTASHGGANRTSLTQWFKSDSKRLLWILLLPFFLIWFAWRKSNWNKASKVIVTVLSSIFIIAALGSNNSSQSSRQQKNTNQEPQSQSQQAELKKAEEQKPTHYKVTKAVDGDTIEVESNGKIESVRLVGIDTPETSHPQKAVECFGEEASEYMKGLVEGKNVRLDPDQSQSDRDKYNRLLRFVFLEDGTHINEKMIRDGYAFEYTYNSNPYQYQKQFIEAQTEARNSSKGLWAANTCNGEHKAATSPKPTPTPQTPSQPPAASSGGAYYANCTEARNAGAAPLREGQAGYRSALDRDKDGVACE